MALETQARLMLPVIEAELKRQVRRVAGQATRPFHEMLSYHLGWRGAVRKGQQGKRIRPLLVMLACASNSERWRDAAPAAAAIELLHNFSLVHDDIQDNSPTRRGRPTLWKMVGVPLAIDAGDALFTIASQAGLDLRRSYEPQTVVTANAILQQACLELTQGQYLDLYHQETGHLPLRSYWKMIDGKTAALLAAATQLGALLGGAGPKKVYAYRKFGQLLGLAFQVEDDILGIWGDEKRTGKSAASDLVEGKLSLPVVFGLSKKGPFAALWRQARARGRNARRLRTMLEDAGAREYANNQAARLTRQAVGLLNKEMRPRGEAGAALRELTEQLLSREN